MGASPKAAAAAAASPFGTSPDAGSLQGSSQAVLPLARRPSSAGWPASETAEAALAALSPQASHSSSATTSQPITIGSRLASSGRPPLPLLSQIRSTASGPTAADQAATSSGRGFDSLSPHPASLGTSPPTAGTSPPSPFHSWWPGLGPRPRASSGAEAGGGDTARAASSDTFASLDGGRDGGRGRGWHLSDPEHLVVCGSGGGFCHPTHVFCEARFCPEHHPAAGPVYLRAPAPPAGQEGSRHGAAAMQRGFPSGSSLYSLGPRGSEADLQRPAGGEYRCQQAFPTPDQVHRGG